MQQIGHGIPCPILQNSQKNAKEIWLGHIRPGGSLESILKATPGQFPTNLP